MKYKEKVSQRAFDLLIGNTGSLLNIYQIRGWGANYLLIVKIGLHLEKASDSSNYLCAYTKLLVLFYHVLPNFAWHLIFFKSRPPCVHFNLMPVFDLSLNTLHYLITLDTYHIPYKTLIWPVIINVSNYTIYNITNNN